MKKPIVPLVLFAAAALGCQRNPDGAPADASSTASDGPFDLLITNAQIVDGTGGPGFTGDVGIRGDRIAAVGELSEDPAIRTIDAAGRILSPGFIDLMGQSSQVLITDPVSAESKLRQGVTTYLSGESGSDAPQSRRTQPDPVRVGRRNRRWQTFPEYFRIVEGQGIPLNVIFNVGLAQVRRIVLGDGDIQPTPDQMEIMKSLVREGMKAGATGVSTALIYPPAVYATTQEIIELARVAAEFDGVYFSHLRNESNGLLDAIREALDIGVTADLPVHIYHIKAAGQENWPLMEEAIALIDSARAEGMDVTADVYPYIRNGIGLSAFLHPKHFAADRDAFLRTLDDPTVRSDLKTELETTSNWENWYRHVGMDWENVLIVSAPDSLEERVVGYTLFAASANMGADPWTAFFDLLQAGSVYVAPKSMNEEQKWQALRAPWVMIDSDAEPANPAEAASVHPRAFGAFPRVIAKYVREDSIIGLEEAVRRMTSLAASRLGLRDRGTVAPGMAADLLIFDEERLRDLAEFNDPLQYSEGIDYLFVNGVPVIDDGALTEVRPGRVLRRGG